MQTDPFVSRQPADAVAHDALTRLQPSFAAVGWPVPCAWRWTWLPDQSWHLELALVLVTPDPLETVVDHVQRITHRFPIPLTVVEVQRRPSETICWLRTPALTQLPPSPLAQPNGPPR
jgi:hypothetical protein